MTDTDTILRAADRVERSWTRGKSARDASGEFVEPTDPSAVCWDMGGAIQAEGGVSEASRYAISRVCGGVPMVGFNDAPGRTAEDVAAKLREAATRIQEGTA